ncbi:MAG: enoyl-CoA hydratase/isomerase family protein [Firmicutes bacterium]|nr:enoyl-CoA hydratase/isomerase family protein [Bacillota bacterium]
MLQTIRSVAVLGAGTMGAQIAAHVANHGIPCLLLDMVPEGAGDKPADRNRLARQALERLTRMKPAPLFGPDRLALITPGNFADDLARISGADWVIEAVVENLDVKRRLWEQAAPLVREDAIASTNTSGIPIHRIAAGLPERFRRQFLGTHFFNPPRYLHLLEVIPTADTDPAVVERIRDFGERVLGKGVVIARDTPNFIGNRIGCYGLMETLRAMEELGLRPDEVDSVTGPAMGRPKSATFRTLDLIGIDVFALVADNLREAVDEQWEREAFVLPAGIRQLMERGWLGEKAGQGFYKRVKSNGQSEILVLDLETFEYVPRRRLSAPSLAAVRNIDDVGERLRRLVQAGDAAGRLAWTVMKRTLLYTARKAAEIAEDIVSIDRAMRWGFGWELGPFEAWDAIGLRESLERMSREGEEIPGWIAQLAGGARPAFYPIEGRKILCAAPAGGHIPVPERPRVITVARLEAEERIIRSAPGATLYDIGDEVALVDFHSPKQAIGVDLVQMLQAAMERVRREFRGLVVTSHVQPNFCVGANLVLLLSAAQEGDWDEVDLMVRQFQGVNMALKYFERPVVIAPYGMTLGGGAELTFAADQVVAAAETYMGLVEVGAGLIPGGGGCKEMLIRHLEGTPGAMDVPSPSGDATAVQSMPDLQPLATRAFELIGTARVSTSGPEAQALRYLRPHDRIVANRDHLWHEAKQAVLAMDAAGYRPPVRPAIPVVGPGGRAVMELAAQHLHWAGYATEHDLEIARKLAYVLSGGEVSAGTRVSEEYLLELEREAFLSLCGHPKSQERMQHILATGKPLRN